MENFRLTLLGQARLAGPADNDNLLPPGKMLALLAYLAAAARPVHRDELAQLLWPDLPREDGRANLRHKVFHLRKLLGDDRRDPALFRQGRDTLELVAHPALHVDLAEFLDVPPSCVHPRHEAHCVPCVTGMRASLARYEGEFMANFHLAGHPEFAEWLEEQRAVYLRHAVAICERLYRCLEQAGNFAGALDYARRLVELDPWQEQAHRDLLRLLAALGQSGEALRHYEAFCRDLRHELGVAPEAATQALAESLRSGAASADSPVPPAQHLAFARPERRQVTVLYCEVAPLAVPDDPEEWGSLIEGPKAACQAILENGGGYVVPFHGSGLLAYFGYPAAREDAARSALNAARACVAAGDVRASVRCGVHTALLLGHAGTPDTSGLASSIAIALRERAAPGQIWVSGATRELVGGYFHLADRGSHRLGAASQEIPCYLASGPSGARSRLEAAGQLTPLAGREAELAKLSAWWETTCAGSGHIVLLRGEAGIGKSRLVDALKHQAAQARHVVRELYCFAEFSQTPFYPLIALFESLLELDADSDPAARAAKLARYVERHYPDTARDAVPLLAQLLSLPVAEPYRDPGYAPHLQRERTLAIVLERLLDLAAHQPVLLIVEDLHWIDPSTLELLSRFICGPRATPVLALLTARPEFRAPWPAEAVAELDLHPLSGAAVSAMLDFLDADLPAAARRDILARSDGVPLFVEEMARMALAGKAFEIPATLQDLLAARLDSMGEVKRMAQLAATIGREFDLALLSQISPPDQAALNRSLDALQKAGVIQKETRGVCQFKHALIQEAVRSVVNGVVQRSKRLPVFHNAVA